MNKLLNALMLSVVLLVTACGGGSSSGGAGGGVTYTGTYTLTGSSGGVAASENGTFTAVVDGDSVKVTFDDGTEFSGEFNSDDVADLTRSVQEAVEGCTSGTITVLVTRPDGTTFTATISSSGVVCEGTSFIFTGSLNGSSN